MANTNYYVVNKETKKIHFLLTADPRFTSPGNSWIAGNLYRADPARLVTLTDLYELDYLGEQGFPNGESTEESLFEFMEYVEPVELKCWDDILAFFNRFGVDESALEEFLITTDDYEGVFDHLAGTSHADGVHEATDTQRG